MSRILVTYINKTSFIKNRVAVRSSSHQYRDPHQGIFPPHFDYVNVQVHSREKGLFLVNNTKAFIKQPTLSDKKILGFVFNRFE